MCVPRASCDAQDSVEQSETRHDISPRKRPGPPPRPTCGLLRCALPAPARFPPPLPLTRGVLIHQLFQLLAPDRGHGAADARGVGRREIRERTVKIAVLGNLLVHVTLPPGAQIERACDQSGSRSCLRPKPNRTGASVIESPSPGPAHPQAAAGTMCGSAVSCKAPRLIGTPGLMLQALSMPSPINSTSREPTVAGGPLGPLPTLL